MIRQGTNLQQLQEEVQEINNIQNQESNQACVWGIQKFFDHKQCYKFFQKNFGEDHNITHLCKYKNKPFFIVRFPETINLQQFNNKYAKTKRVKIRPVSKQTQTNQQDFIEIIEIKKHHQKVIQQALPQDIQQTKNIKIQDIVQGYHNLPYNQQILLKTKDINKVIENYNSTYFKDPEVKRLLKDNYDIPPMKLDRFVQCQGKKTGYRTKTQFTIGMNDKNEPVVGFNKGSYSKKTIMVENPKNVSIISKNTKLIAVLTQNFIKNQQQFTVYNRFTQEGFWRYLVVRQSQRMKQSLVFIVCKTKGIEPDKLSALKQRMIEYYKKSIIGLKSLCFLDYQGQADSIPTISPQILYGSKYYQQKIFDQIFQVSPTAFLQIHIEMCQVLYTEIIKAVKQCDVILDLGCGIGTIGISIQKHLPNAKVIGIEICQEAVEDAKINSQNYQVWLGRAQDHIKSICDLHRGKRIVAILDPPRAGFNKQVMIALRRCRGLDNLIYVACNAGAIQDNLLQLTLPVTQKRKAPQFLLKQVIGFDLFPQTKHYEVLYILERK